MKFLYFSLILLMIVSCGANNSANESETEDPDTEWFPDDWVTEYDFPDEKFNIEKVFPDKGFRECLQRLDRIEDWNDLLKIDEISCLCGSDGEPINDVTGLEYLVNLYEIRAYDCSLTIDKKDVTTLKRLHRFMLLDGKLKSISFIKELKKLDGIVAKNSQLENIEPVKNHPTLRQINFIGNYIKNADIFLTIPNLNSLSIDNNCIEDIEPLERLKDKGIAIDVSYERNDQNPEKCQ